MAEITFNCPICSAEIEADETLCGGVANCPSCSNNIAIPMPGMRKGMKIAGFVLERRLGAGGMGEVWLATQTAMDRKVALKILSPALTKDISFVNRFLTEVKNSAKLEHKNIITAHDAGVESGIYYLAISYVNGIELGDRLKIDNILDEKEALKIIKDIAEALKYAWNKHKILHRDIKPANIMIDSDGTTKLMDMGISKSLDSGTNVTMAGTIMGTPLYMSPEQATGDEDIDFRSDIYSLGATLYHMLAGSAPYDATTPMGIITKHVTEPLPPPRERNSDISEECAALIEIMMAKDKNKRQDSWETVIEDIGLVLNGQFPSTKRPDTSESGAQMTPSQFLKKQKKSDAYPAKIHSKTTVFSPSDIPSENITECKAKKPISLMVIYGILLIVMASAGYHLYSQIFKKTPSSYSTIKAPAKVDPRGSAAPLQVNLQAPSEDKESKEEKNQREMWDFAVGFMNDNPDEIDQSLANFSDIKSKLGHTKYKMMADVEINKLNKLKKAAVSSIIDSLKTKAKTFADKSDYEKAINVYKDYSGRYAKETADDRLKLTAELSQLAASFKEEKKKENIEYEKKKKELLSNIVGELLRDNTTGACKIFADSELKTSLPEVEKILNELSNVNKIILENFTANIDKDIEIDTDKGLIKTKVKKVKDNTIYIEEKINKGFVQKGLQLKDLTTREKARRISGRVSKETETLYKVLDALKSKKYGFVEKNTTATGPFAEAFNKYLTAVNTEKLEQTAEKKLKEILQKYKLPQDIPLNMKVMPVEIRKQMLTDKQLNMLQDELNDYKKIYENTKFFNENKQSVLAMSEILDRIFEHRKNRPFMKDKPEGGENKKSGAVPRTPEELNNMLTTANPDYKGNANIQVNFNRITGIDLSQCPEVKDITPLKGLKLTHLTIRSPDLTDISALERMPLLQLFLQANVEDISPLKGMQLKALHIESKHLTDISVLEKMPLEQLFLGGEITDISVLKGMKLTGLYIANARISDISVLEGMPIQRLYLPESVSDIDILKNMPLEELHLPNVRISDISALKGMKLRLLDLMCTNVSDISPLRGMPLRELNLAGCDALTDISPLLDCKSLEKLVIPPGAQNQEALKKLKALKMLDYRWPPAPATDFWTNLKK